MEKKIKLDMHNMKILQFEVGNMKSYTPSQNIIRPVCALLLTDQTSTHKCKVIFKHQDAVHIYNYIKGRYLLGKIKYETIDIIGSIREFRKDCVVVDDVERILIDLKLELQKC